VSGPFRTGDGSPDPDDTTAGTAARPEIGSRAMPAVGREAAWWTTSRRPGRSGYSQYVFGMLPLIAMSTRFTHAEPVG
jgi:hypothetical protein